MANLARRSPFAGLARRLGRSATSIRRASGAGADLARRGYFAAAPVVRTKTREIYRATKEPMTNVAMREGVSLIPGHGGAYVIDRLIPLRWWGGWLRPSVFYGFAFGALSALTRGKWRVLFRNITQGTLHHYFARALDKINAAVSAPGAPSGTSGTEGQSDAY